MMGFGTLRRAPIFLCLHNQQKTILAGLEEILYISDPLIFLLEPKRVLVVNMYVLRAATTGMDVLLSQDAVFEEAAPWAVAVWSVFPAPHVQL